MDYRWEKLKRKLEEKNLDAFLITSRVDIFYFSGVWVEGAALFTPHRKFILTSPMYREETEKIKNRWEIAIYKNTLENTLKKIAELIKIKRCGFEQNSLTFAGYKRIKENFSSELVPCDFVGKIRSVKEKEEIEFIKKAAKITLSAFDYLRGILHTGIREKDVARECINYILKEADDLAFDPIVLFGERTSLPHGAPTERKLKKGDLVTIDIGARVKGYCADITRTFVWGSPPSKTWEERLKLLESVKRKAIERIKPGVKSSEIHKIVKEELTRKGYAENFLHGTGHGVGLEVHEEPFIKQKSNTSLKDGMVITVEPGIYFSGEGGARLEDTILVTSKGGKILP